MKGLRGLILVAGLLVSLLAGTQAFAANGQIYLPCASTAGTYSDLLNSQTLPNGVCGWTTTIGGGGGYSIALKNTDSADLDVSFFDNAGSLVGFYPGSGCGDLSGSVPAAARRVVVTLSPSMCESQFNVTFSYS